MEVKINKDIREFSESVFLGLSVRQLVFSALAIGVAVLLYFTLRSSMDTETVSWLCILGAAPFAAMGFVRYHGMSAERLLWTFFRSEVLEPGELPFASKNAYFEAFRDILDAASLKEYKRNEKDQEG